MSIRSRLFGASLGITRPTYLLCPTPGGGNNPGVTITPGAAAFGGYLDILGAATVPVSPTVEFWLMEVIFDSFAGAFGLRAVEIFNATEARTVYQCRVIVIAATVNLTPFPIPIPVYCAPSAQIQCRCGATNAADTINVSLLVATGL